MTKDTLLLIMFKLLHNTGIQNIFILKYFHCAKKITKWKI